MNAHSAPPGDWQPPEPPWMNDARQIVERIKKQVDRHVRAHRWGFLIWMTGGLSGYWIGFGTVELVKWWAGIK